MNIQYGGIGGISTAYRNEQDQCCEASASVYETQRAALKNLDEAINVLEKRLDDVLCVCDAVPLPESLNTINCKEVNVSGRLKSQVNSNNLTIQRFIDRIQSLTDRVDLH